MSEIITLTLPVSTARCYHSQPFYIKGYGFQLLFKDGGIYLGLRHLWLLTGCKIGLTFRFEVVGVTFTSWTQYVFGPGLDWGWADFDRRFDLADRPDWKSRHTFQIHFREVWVGTPGAGLDCSLCSDGAVPAPRRLSCGHGLCPDCWRELDRGSGYQPECYRALPTTTETAGILEMIQE